MKWIYKSLSLALIGASFSLYCSRSAIAQATLTSADVREVSNSVSLNIGGGGWNPASVGDQMVPQDSLRTGASSRAALMFNDGTLVRTGEGTTFRFPPGQRSFELINGTTLIMIRPGLGASRINTPEASIIASGTALFVQHDEASNTSLVGVLTESPAGPVTVTDANGEGTIQLTAGQFVSVANGVLGLVEDFILPAFYDSVDMAIGLAPGQESFVGLQAADIQETLNAVRAESIGPLNKQVALIGELCQTGGSTLRQTTSAVPLLSELLPPAALAMEAILPAAMSTTEAALARLPENDIVVTPWRSPSGTVWIGKYCTEQFALP